VYAGYIGGSGSDGGGDIALDSAGAAYVVGATGSTESTFPAVIGPDLTYNGGSLDVFVAKVTANGEELVYAGYIGGSGGDRGGAGIAVDSVGNAFVVGCTESTEATFPVTGGPDLTHNGSDDAFVAKVNAEGTGLVYAGYIGGSGRDFGQDIVVDSVGNVFVVGYTESTEATFPVTVGPDLTYNGGNWDAFVAKVYTDGTGLAYAGYIGGDATDMGLGVAVHSSGNAYVAGVAGSSEATFPVAIGPDLSHNGFWDGFVAKVEFYTNRVFLPLVLRQ
jgi:hypothetical protein